MLGDRAKVGPTVTKRSLWFHRNSRWLGDEPVGGPPPPARRSRTRTQSLGPDVLGTQQLRPVWYS